MIDKEIKTILWILFSTMIIFIGAGHGVGPVIMIQFYTIFGASSEIWILPTILFSFAQLSLCLAIFWRNRRQTFLISGIVLSVLGICDLILLGSQPYNSALPTYYTAIPFVFLVIKKIIQDVSNNAFE